MKKSQQAVVGLMFVLAAAGPAGPSQAASQPIVVELFTSQGCSSCPPANANLIELSKRRDVLVLSFAVTYWDYLGWKDSFGREEYTERQRIYEPALGQPGPYTPQMVVNGSATAVGNNLAEIEQLVDAAAPTTTPELSLTNGRIDIGAGDAPSIGADVWLVRYDPNVVQVPVGRGENTGRTLPHTHVVHMLRLLGEWNGAARSFDTGAAEDGMRTAVLVQNKGGGPILASVTD
ncbi:hypothetical protein VW23_018320 [Devosia insulae DS-56]|uniref:DUF1223 domain-containing protein n=1 Tax=Devosia insulae DS-56 TaxID=1116389 RepID=A0A1E5XRB9_9HYPH|nr:DUF1223 domain-containing protein [Devosia insulae]OEO31044.1 hypothetical protein VW23_018320 [Devosia insulae DS-56]